MEASIKAVTNAIPGIQHVLSHIGIDDFGTLTMRVLAQVKHYKRIEKIQIYTANAFTGSVETIDQAVKDLVDRQLIKESVVGRLIFYEPT
jgi:hypothetical protein